MQLGSRKLINLSFIGMGYVSIILLALSLLVLLVPIFVRGSGAFVFKGTVEYRRMMLNEFDRGSKETIEKEYAASIAERKPLYDMIASFENKIPTLDPEKASDYQTSLDDLKTSLRELLGPFPGETVIMAREKYGQTRWDRALVKLHNVMFTETYDYSNPDVMGVKVTVPRAKEFEGTSLEPLFPYLENNLSKMMKPSWTFYWRFLFDTSVDSHFFGGLWPELLGTIYLTLGAMLFAVPIGIISAIYLVEYAGESIIVRILRTFVSTLAGVPSIVFGLFGLAFFINTMHVSESKSVLAGALTLSILILPVVIRASEEAIRAVPSTYKEAALSLGASNWRTVVKVLIPAALPGILTGIILSMGRAAGETAPIIFTAAVSVGKPLQLLQTLSEPTPALPWNIYNLATEHEAVDEIRHVQYGMVLTLVLLVLILNATAIVLRAHISKKLKG
jgi:phosphate transport system permease protein